MESINIVKIRAVRESPHSYKIESSAKVKEVINGIFELSTRTEECFGMLCLCNNQVYGAHILAVGQIAACSISPRDILSYALANNSSRVILFHNHPGGTCMPSISDDEVTKYFAACLAVAEIELLDHIIVTSNNEYYSYNEKGRLPRIEFSATRKHLITYVNNR